MKPGSQILRFALVGAAGFGLDVCVLYLARARGLDLYSSRLFSFLAAATFTWLGNRRFTFRTPSDRRLRLGGEWLSYLGAMAVGGLVNYGSYAALIAWLGPFRSHPWLAVAAGTGTGMTINFLFARRILYRPSLAPPDGAGRRHATVHRSPRPGTHPRQ